MSDHKPFKIVVAEPYSPAAVAKLQEFGEVTILENSAPDTLIAALSEADALMVRAKTHVTARIINAGPNLKVIGRASPTVDHIDLRAAKRREISVVYSPTAAATSTAEFTLGLILAMHRKIMFLDRQLREGKFEVARKPSVHEMGQLTVGMLGLDPVAQKVGRMIKLCFGSDIIYTDQLGEQQEPEDFEARRVDLEQILTDSDILTIHLRLNKETRGIIGGEQIRKMKSPAILVNTSRGGVIDTKALADALHRHHIAGAALDVFEAEPLPINHPLRKAPNCILTPHVAGATLDATASRFNVADDVVRVLRGEEPQFPVAMPNK